MKYTAATRQIHVRVSLDLKKAVKMFCARDATTEQSWVRKLIEHELRRKAPDLWKPKSSPPSGNAKRR